MSESNEQLFLGLLHTWETGGADACMDEVRELFTDDCVWHQPSPRPPRAPTRRSPSCRRGGRRSRPSSSISATFASTESSVLVERVDIFERDDGSTSLPVVGVAEFRDGKIWPIGASTTTDRGRARARQLTNIHFIAGGHMLGSNEDVIPRSSPPG